MPDGFTSSADLFAQLPISANSVRPTVRAFGAGNELLLYGDIGTDVTARGVVDALASMPRNAPLSIRINSGGGSVFEGFAAYGALARWGGRKTVTIDGIAASMASLLAMAGDDIAMPATSWLMLHEPFGAAGGRADELRNFADLLDRLRAQMVTIYATRTGRDPAAIVAMLAAETWLDADQALALGFATRKDEAAPIAAALDLSRFSAAPALARAFAAAAPSHPKGPPVPNIITAPAASLADLERIAHRARLGDDWIVGQLATGATPEAALAAAASPPARGVPATAAELAPLAQHSGLGSDWVLAQLRAGVTLQDAREAVIDARASQPRPPLCTANPSAVRTREYAAPGTPGELEPMARAMGDALVARMAGGTPSADARTFMGASLIDMARATLEARGRASRWDTATDVMDKVFASAGQNTTSDFPNLLQYAGGRVLMQAYQRAQSPLRTALCRVREVPDFRSISVLRLSEPPQLLPVLEGGEITHGAAAEAKEAYRVSTFARLFSLSRNAIINDDLGAFASWAGWIGAAAAEAEAAQLVALLTANVGVGANLQDGHPLFYASRGNMGTGLLTVAGVSAGRAALRTTKGLDGITPVAAEPRYVLVSPDNETYADQVVTAITPHTAADVNPFASRLEKLCEPRLSGAPWYLFADPANAPVFEVAYLAGNPGPELKTSLGWETLGVEMRAVLDFGAGLIGWRGAWRSTGA